MKNENSKVPDDMERPRVRWPNDIMPDKNPLSEMSRQAQDCIQDER